MEKFKSSLSKTLKDLGSSFSDDVNMEDMSDYVLSPYEGPSSGCTSDAIAGMLEKPVVRTAVAPTPVSDDDIIDSIDACYFIEDDFDAIDYELKAKTFWDRSALGRRDPRADAIKVAIASGFKENINFDHGKGGFLSSSISILLLTVS
ncbi:hypothetical protein ANCDUO_12774 [Ancylostoma duodenale]|uniref:Uncharacterized protein n=1 Tax=Ancylostoma duodenale TaxID=51022 RepID=A0A0C2GIY2_9BILA|nr:hypothetical protein ANCDUO_12774 [Ancylostoma duodenale]